jgi:riboflavin kinase/FMN adenylyltransferase
MRIARSLEQAEGCGPSALTIGKFDGVHAGHSLLLSQVVDAARKRGLKPAAMTFYPHPACVVAPDRVPKPLMSLEERCDRISSLGIEELFILQFTKEVARLSPEEFVSRFVAEAMRAKVVIVGENFRFGHQQAGDPAMLGQLGERYRFETRLVAPVKRRGMIVSTSAIRSLLEQGGVSRAARLLGRGYSVMGDVVSGFGVGSRQTVPTLNLRPGAEVLPLGGVYITRTTDVPAERCWKSITNIGSRPTFGGNEITIETYLLDPLDGGTPARISVEFLKRVREEQKFETPEALKRQIMADVAQAQRFFRRLAHGASTALQ